MRILFLDTKPNNPNRYISAALFDALKINEEVSEVVWCEYQNALSTARNGHFDAFIAFDGEEADNFVLRNLTKLIRKSAIWFTEDPYEIRRNIEISSLFKLTYTNDKFSSSFYTGSSHHLPLAGDMDMHFRSISAEKKKYDIFFAGTAWPNRLEFLQKLRQERPALKYRFILVANEAIYPHIKDYMEEFEFTKGVSIRDFCSLANSSYLTLTLPRTFSGDASNPHKASDTPGPRFFETALAGTAQLVDTEVTHTATGLLPSNAFISYETFDDCLRKIDEALLDRASMLRVAQLAQEEVKAKHLYAHRADHIVQDLKNLNIEADTETSSASRKVLMVCHNVIAQGNFGGAEIYADHIRTNVTGFDIWQLWPVRQKGGIHEYVLTAPGGHEETRITLSSPIDTRSFVNPEFDHHFQKLLSQHAFDIVHFNHVLGYPLNMISVAKAYGAQTTFSLHDYFLICENFNLIGFEGRFCGFTQKPQSYCDVCLMKTRHLPVGTQLTRRRFLAETLDKLDLVYAGSESSRDILLHTYPQLEGRVQIIPPANNINIGNALLRGSREPLNIAILGNLTRVKGADTILKVIEASAPLNVRFNIFGRIDADVQRKLDELKSERVNATGEFQPGTIPDGLLDCSVALILSPWPETYCISLSEVQALGIVPIVTDLGAQSERVIHDHNGLKVPLGDAQAVIASLKRLLREPDLLNTLAANKPDYIGWAPAAFALEVERSYTSLVDGYARLESVENVKRVFRFDELGMPFVQIGAPPAHVLSPPAHVRKPRPGKKPTKAKEPPLRRKSYVSERIALASTLGAQFKIVTKKEGLGTALGKTRKWIGSWVRRKRGL